MTKLNRSKTDRKLTGLLGGLGEYMKVDPTILRVVFLILVVFTGFLPGVFFYIVAAMVVPEPTSAKK